MKILGVYNGKVASVTYFDGKKIVFSASEERFNRIKNSRGYPNQTIDYLLENYNINPNDIDIVTCGAWNYPDYDVFVIILTSLINQENLGTDIIIP